MRRSCPINVDGISRNPRLPAQSLRLPGVGIHVETWEVAARYIDPDPMARLEKIAGRERLDGDFIDLPRLIISACSHDWR